MTDDEVRLAAYAYALRADEQDTPLWFRPADDVFLEAIRLHERGWLDRDSHNGELVFRLADAGVVAHRAHASMN
jgi:hypothetical protein